jgi:hypothetical protein
VLQADFHNILNRWKNYFPQLLNVHRVSDVRNLQIHTVEPLVPDPSHFEVESAIAKLKRYKYLGSDKLRQNWFKQKVKRYGLRSINSLILFRIRKYCLISGRSLPVHKKGDTTDCNNYRGISLLSTSYKILSHILIRTLRPHTDKIIEDYQCGFRHNISTAGQIFSFDRYWRKDGIHELFVDLKKAYGSVRSELLYNILIEFCVLMKLVRQIKMCLNEIHIEVRIGK